MKLTEAIKDLQSGTKHYKLIVLNQESKECINDCKSLDFDGLVKIDVTKLLIEELLDGKTEEAKKHETWEFIKSYLDSLDFKILVLHNVDYMFSKELGNHDVIYDFKYYSRNGHVIVLFINGKLSNNHIIHSEEGNTDYKNMDVSEVIVMGWE